MDEEQPIAVGGASGRHLSLSGEYMQRIPGGSSPSLRHPTRMLKSIENEDTKSAQSSRISIPGSKTSIQGSRPSVFSSQASFLQSGSRSQMFSSALSNEPVSLSREGGGRRDDDTLSLPLSGRTTSPPLQQSSLNSSFEAPTRDEPSSITARPLASSHDLGAGVKDFASMTNIAQHSILSPELGSVRVPLDLEPEAPSESKNTRRLSLINCDLGALTTITDDKSKSDAKEAPKKDNGTPKKGRSKMSRLEMLTSLRASMRKAAKKVSFKSKKQKENESAQAEQEATPTKDNPVRRHSDILENPLASSGGGGGDPPRGMRPRAYTDLTAQLSQPNLYYPPVPHGYHHGNPYQQLSQTYPVMPPPAPLFDEPFSHRQPVPGDYPPRYTGVITPDYSDLTTPDHGHYGNPDRARTPDQYLQHDDSASDDYPLQQRPSSPQGGATSPSSASYTSNEGGDHFPLNSDLYRNPASHGGMVKPLPTVHERRYQFNDGPDMFPQYNPDAFTSPSRRGGGAQELYMGGASMYPPSAMYPGNGYPIPPPPPGEYFEDMRRNSLDRGFRGLDQMGTFHERRSSYDQNGGGDFPHPQPYPRRESRDYEPRDHDNRRRSILSDNSDLSASRNRVSWNTEVIEYARTPSDGSNFDLNEL